MYKLSIKQGCISVWCICILLLSSYILQAQTQVPERQWDKRYGGSDVDRIYSVIRTNDGGYLLAGYSSSDLGGDKTERRRDDYPVSYIYDSWIVKIDSVGNKLWDKTLGGGSNDEVHSVVLTNDGGYLLAGHSASGKNGDKTEETRGQVDYWIVKIDSIGKKVWDKTFGGNRVDSLTSMAQTVDGKFLLAGYSNSSLGRDKTTETRGGMDYWIVMIDSVGNKLWDKSFGGQKNDYASSVISTNDGGYLLAGYSTSTIGGDKTEESRGEIDYWIVKTDKDGIKQWDKTFGGGGVDSLSSVIQTSDDGYLLAGLSSSGISVDKTEESRGEVDYWIVKTNKDGIKQWDKTFGGNKTDRLTSLIKNSDGNYILAGYSYSFKGGDKSVENSGDRDFWIVNMDSIGQKKWDKQFGGTSSDVLFSVIATDSGELLLAGDSDSEIGGDKSQASRGKRDFWIVKASNKITSLPPQSQKQAGHKVFPNPFSEGVFIQTDYIGKVIITVSDLLGNTFYHATHQLQPQSSNQLQTSQLQLNLSGVSMKAGMYIIRLQAENGTSQLIKVFKM